MLSADALLGSWRLERAELLSAGVANGVLPFGPAPTGMIHYLADGRMAVLIAHDGRRAMAGDRGTADDGEWARAARSFMAYAGTFAVEGDCVFHHLDISSYQRDCGATYERIVRLDGDILTLSTPATLPADQRAMRLIWRRL